MICGKSKPKFKIICILSLKLTLGLNIIWLGPNRKFSFRFGPNPLRFGSRPRLFKIFGFQFGPEPKKKLVQTELNRKLVTSAPSYFSFIFLKLASLPISFQTFSKQKPSISPHSSSYTSPSLLPLQDPTISSDHILHSITPYSLYHLFFQQRKELQNLKKKTLFYVNQSKMYLQKFDEVGLSILGSWDTNFR